MLTKRSGWDDRMLEALFYAVLAAFMVLCL